MRIATDHREAILLTAARLFARKPFHEVLMDDVAIQAGIAKGTIYRYYPNKEELFAALSVRFLERLTGEISRAGTGEPLGCLRKMLTRMVAFIAENNDFFRVMQRRECEVFERKGSEFLQRRTTMRDLFAEQLRAASKLGLVNCPFGETTAADMLMGMVRNILRFTVPLPTPERTAEMVMEVFINGVGSAGRRGKVLKKGGELVENVGAKRRVQ